MKELIKEYKEALRSVNKAKMKATDEEDRKLLGSCADSLKFAIEYMEKGKHPENRRAITRLSGEQREIPTDPDSYQFIKAAVLQRRTRESLNETQKEMIDDLLGILTTKEREAFVMVRGNGYSFGETADILGVKKGTIQNLVTRAEKKIYFVVRKPPISEGNICSIEFRRPVQRVMF